MVHDLVVLDYEKDFKGRGSEFVLKMFKLFLQKLESGFKDLSGNNSFSDESV